MDSFKKINDTNGHLFGDAVLCSFADELSNIFPEALKGRIGGDEFVFYVEDMDREHLEEKLKQLNRCMSDRYDDDKTGLHISCSLGAAVTDGTVTDYNLLFQWADAALYQVKSKGKGAYYLLDVKEGVALPARVIWTVKRTRRTRLPIKRHSLRVRKIWYYFAWICWKMCRI